MSNIFAVRTQLAPEMAQKLADELGALEDFALSAASFEIDATNWGVELHFDHEPKIAELEAQAASIIDSPVTFETFQLDSEIDWVAETLSSLKPISAGEFFVFGAHDKDRLPSDKIGIEIEAALAFGTGKHETTFGCLEAINGLTRQYKHVLDLGCGSAILAMAYALKFGAKGAKILATDIDPIAIEQAKINLRANELDTQIEALAADGLDHGSIQSQAPFDLILANILANPLVELAPDIARASTKNTTLILSGLLARQIEMVMDAYTPHDFKLSQEIIHGEWACLIVERGQ